MTELGPRLMTPRILWGALLASKGIYVGMLLAGVSAPPEHPPDAMLLPIFIGIAMVTAVASFLVPDVARRNELARTTIEVREVPDPAAPVGFRGAAPTVRVYADPAKVIAQAFSLGLTPLILSLALSEAVTVYGFVLGMIGHPPEAWAGFFVVGVTLTVIRFPTAGTFLGPIEKHTGVPLTR